MAVRQPALAEPAAVTAPPCRLCAAPLHRTFADLGSTPLANAFLTPEQAAAGMDRSWPLHVRVCESCLLVQADAAVPPEAIFSEYAYFSSVSSSWVAHAGRLAALAIERFALGPQSLVLEVASNDGYLLQHFVSAGVPVLGIEPAANVAAVARARGIPTETMFFGRETAQALAARGVRADLLVGCNVLAHVPDPAGFVAGCACVLAPGGVLVLEFPHVLRLIEGVQFDTIYHEHFSYLSLLVVEQLLALAGLRVFDVAELPSHGGSLRVFACHTAAAFGEQAGLAAVRRLEREAGLLTPAGYGGFAERVADVQRGLRAFLAESRQQGRRVAAYGAAAKGCTLLNSTGVGAADLLFVADRSPAKQGLLLPGCRLNVVPPDTLIAAAPDGVLILPWNLAAEIAGELAPLRAAGTRLWVAVPQVIAI